MQFTPIILVGLIMFPILGNAQSNGNNRTRNQPTSLHPGSRNEVEQSNSQKKKAKRVKYDSPELEAIKRKEEIVKQERKVEAMRKKPQYSNPLYFGHKNLPKKHSPDKMRYCKVCGIRH